MILCYVIFVVASLLEVNSKDFKSNTEIEDLVNFIDLLNNPDSDVTDTNLGKSLYLKDAAFKGSGENEKTNELMRLLQQNYDARVITENQYQNGERLHLISNPEVIDEYRNYLKKRHPTEIQYDEEIEERSLQQLLQTLRRNSISGMKKDGNRSILRLGANIRSFESQEKSSKDVKFGKSPYFDMRDTIKEKYDWNKSLEERKRKTDERDFGRPKPKPKIKPKVIRDEGIYRKPKGRNGHVSFGRTSIPFSGKRGVFDDVFK